MSYISPPGSRIHEAIQEQRRTSETAASRRALIAWAAPSPVTKLLVGKLSSHLLFSLAPHRHLQPVWYFVCSFRGLSLYCAARFFFSFSPPL